MNREQFNSRIDADLKLGLINRAKVEGVTLGELIEKGMSRYLSNPDAPTGDSYASMIDDLREELQSQIDEVKLNLPYSVGR